jgi:hypothetical protein
MKSDGTGAVFVTRGLRTRSTVIEVLTTAFTGLLDITCGGEQGYLSDKRISENLRLDQLLHSTGLKSHISAYKELL